MFFFYYFFSEVPLKGYEKNFPEDIKKMSIETVTDPIALEKTPELAETGFFGRPQWGNFERDIRKIKNKSDFVRCLYVSLLLKRAVETYYPNAYLKYDKARMLPEFGWQTFAFSREKLSYLLSVPEWESGEKNAFYTKTDARELVFFLFEKAQKEIIPLGIDITDFMGKIVDDPDILQDELLRHKGKRPNEPESLFYNKFLSELKKQYRKECSFDD